MPPTTRLPDRLETLLEERMYLYGQPLMSAFSAAVIKAVAEAVYNRLLMASTVTGRDGRTRYGPAARNAPIICRQSYARIEPEFRAHALAVNAHLARLRRDAGHNAGEKPTQKASRSSK